MPQRLSFLDKLSEKYSGKYLQKRQPRPSGLPLLSSRQPALTKTDLPPEDSWLLRLLVQALVTVGICAMAVAATGVHGPKNLTM